MHNEVMAAKPGECPKCNMKLVKQKMTAEQEKMREHTQSLNNKKIAL